ncbi:hypothetical protein OYC64_019873 [Pagothenia borchgrevinki]|uniref:Rab11 family-interacting protein 1-like n=1 Tax=Pagothenia borchgrevinki TaxID=8213 RepID=A0ABD2FJQ5_PAGBO
MSLADLQWCPTSVQVTVLQSRGLRIKGKNGTNDAYAIMQVGKEKFQTSVVEKSVAPVWKEEAAFDLPPPGRGGPERSTLHVHVLHRALVGPDKLLGQAVINLLELSVDKTRSKTEWFKLLDKTGKADKDRGEVLVDIQFMRNNMTASMFDISAAGKSKSRLGKFKDKVRGKKKESDAASNMLPSFSQVLTDSEEEGNGEVTAGKDDTKKKHKMKSLFSTKSNLQRNMSQSMSILPAKNSSLSSSQSSGLNVDSSEGKKKFKFMNKRSDGKHSGHQKQGAAEQSNLCINGSHVYREEPPPRSSRIGSNFSLTSSGHSSMEDVPENSPPSVDSLRAVRQYSPWTEEEEEVENMEEDVEEQREEERIKMEKERSMKQEEEERVRKQEEELERLAEEKRLEEEERREEERVRKEEEDRIRREEEERAQEERRQQEEEERERLVEVERRQEEEERERLVEVERRQEEEERERLVEVERRQEEEERVRKEEEERTRMEEKRVEEERRREEEERARRQEDELAEEKRRLEEERQIKEEGFRKEKGREQERAEEERREREEEGGVRSEDEEHEKKRRREEQEERQREEEDRIRRRQEESARREEQCTLAEKRRVDEEGSFIEEMVREEERVRREEKEAERRQRETEEMVREEERVRREKEAEEERIQRETEEMVREEERVRREEKEAEEERRQRETEEMVRRQQEEEQERRQREKEERMKTEEEEQTRREEETLRQEEERRRIEAEEKMKQEERIRMEEEEMRRKEEEMRKEEERKQLAEEKRKLEEEEMRRIEEEEERFRKEEERRRVERAKKEERLLEEKMRRETQRIEEEEKVKREEERIRREEKAEDERGEEQARKLEEEKATRKAEKQKKKDASQNKLKAAVEIPAEVSSNPFDEDPDSPAGADSDKMSAIQHTDKMSAIQHTDKMSAIQHTDKMSAIQQRVQSAAPLVGSKSISTDEKDPISAQRERRLAPQPPGRNQDESQKDGSAQQLPQMTKKSSDKDIKTVSVLPQRSVQMIAPISRPSTDTKNTQSLTQSSATKETSNEAKHSKRPAPLKPLSVEEEPSSKPKITLSSDGSISHKCLSVAKQVPIAYGLNPFEDGEDDIAPEDEAAPSSETGLGQRPSVASQAADKDDSSQTKIKPSKARAPLPFARKAATMSTLINQNKEGEHVTGATDNVTHASDPKSEAKKSIHIQEAPLRESQPATVQSAGEEAGGKKGGAPVPLRRLQPVKPLNPLEQQSVSVVQGERDTKSLRITCEDQEKTKVNAPSLKGPYSELTQEELISLVLKQENKLSDRGKKISELELYIDNLLVRIIEEKPSILMSLNSAKKAA